MPSTVTTFFGAAAPSTLAAAMIVNNPNSLKKPGILLIRSPDWIRRSVCYKSRFVSKGGRIQAHSVVRQQQVTQRIGLGELCCDRGAVAVRRRRLVRMR